MVLLVATDLDCFISNRRDFGQGGFPLPVGLPSERTSKSGAFLVQVDCLSRRARESDSRRRITTGRVAQMGEHLLCKHAFIPHKSLNLRRVQSKNPLLIGLRVSNLGHAAVRLRSRLETDGLKYTTFELTTLGLTEKE